MYTLKQLKKMDKSDGYQAFLQELPEVVKHYFKNCICKKPEMEILHEKLSSLKGYARFVKHACKVEDSNPFPDGYSFILIDFIKKQAALRDPADVDEDLDEVLTIYSNAIEKMNKSRQKQMAKDLKMPKPLALELAVIYPGEVISKYNAWVFIRELSYRLSQLQKTYCPVVLTEEMKTQYVTPAAIDDKAKKTTEPAKEQQPEAPKIDPNLMFDFAEPKFIKKVFKGFFGKDEAILEKVYANIMLDKLGITSKYNTNQKRLWDAITKYMLTSLNKMDPKSIKRVIDFYVKRRNFEKTRDVDVARRVSLSDISYDEYPNIASVIDPETYPPKKSKKDKKGKKKKK